MDSPLTLKISTDLEVLPPIEKKAFPIPCDEWRFLKGKINALRLEPWLFRSLGSLLVGITLSTLIYIFTGLTADSTSNPNAIIIAWAVSLGSLLSGVLCLIFAQKEGESYKTMANEIVTQMELIETRFPAP